MNKPDAGPQPIVTLLDRLLPPDEDDAPDPDWDELTTRVARLAPADRETVLELAERRLARMGL